MIPYTAATAPPATAATARPPHTHHPTALLDGPTTRTDCTKLRPPLLPPTPPPLAAALARAGPKAASCRLLTLLLLLLRRSSGTRSAAARVPGRREEGPRPTGEALLLLAAALLSVPLLLPLSPAGTAAIDPDHLLAPAAAASPSLQDRGEEEGASSGPPVLNQEQPWTDRGLAGRGEEHDPTAAPAKPPAAAAAPTEPLLLGVLALRRSRGVAAVALGEDAPTISLPLLLNRGGFLPRGDPAAGIQVPALPPVQCCAKGVLGPCLGERGRTLPLLPRGVASKPLLLLPPLLPPLLFRTGSKAAPGGIASVSTAAALVPSAGAHVLVLPAAPQTRKLLLPLLLPLPPLPQGNGSGSWASTGAPSA